MRIHCSVNELFHVPSKKRLPYIAVCSAPCRYDVEISADNGDGTYAVVWLDDHTASEAVPAEELRADREIVPQLHWNTGEVGQPRAKDTIEAIDA